MNHLSNEAINQLRQNARSVVRELGLLNEAYFEIGVTLAERHLLIELSNTDSPTMKEIADRLLLDKSTISRLIAKAVKKGYVECITDNVVDKRKRFLHLTEKGFQTLHAFEPIAFNQTKNALLTLTPKETENVYQGVSLYAQGLKNARLKKDKPQEIFPKKIGTLSEFINQFNALGCTLELFKDEDKEALHKIFQESVNQFPYENDSIEELELQFFKPDGKVYVCKNQEHVIGSFYLRANFPGRSGHIANAAYMISEGYRGQGIGSLLVQASLHLAKDLGFQAMQFNMVFSNNTVAVKLYEKLGFKIIGIIPEAIQNFDGSYQDGYIMYQKL